MDELRRTVLVVIVLTMLGTHATLRAGQSQRAPAARDVEYAKAGNISLQLDLYLPEEKGPHPLIIWVHGGAFRAGDKGRIWWNPMPRQTERGYAVASINYRLSGQAQFPALVYDVKAAIRWLRANATKHELKADRIVIAGESAGGHLAAFMGTSGGAAELEDLSMGNPKESSRVQGVIDFFGPTDFLQMDAGIPRSCEKPAIHSAPESPESQLLGCNLQACPDKVKTANPIAYISKDDPPFLIMHGTGDCTVPSHQSQLLFDALKAAGVQAALNLFPGYGHGDKRFFTAENERQVNEFIDAVLKPGAAGVSQRAAISTRAAGRSEDIPPFNSVEYGEGGGVTFRMYAPAAKSVELIGEIVTVSGRDSIPMTRDARGIWSAEITGVRPELSSYLFMVDGAPVMDQRNPGTKVGPRGNSNRFDMPGSPDFYAPGDVPHGKVEINWHRSAILNETRPIWIYTPPGYAANTNERYPVMYLLHGSGDLESGWTEDGRANFILDNLIAARKAKPMLIVMPQGHVYRDRQIEREKNNDALEQVLIREVIPFVDSNYRVLSHRNNRAVVGLSMGGGQSLRFGLHNLDKFAYVIGLSPAVMYSPAELEKRFSTLIADPKQSNQLLKLLMIRCGTKDHLLDASDNFTKFLTAHGIGHQYERIDYERLWPGRKDDHTWPIWRMDLQAVAPLLFR